MDRSRIPRGQHNGPVKRDIRFCTTSDGVRIAYATYGSGYPFVWVPGWITHLELDWALMGEAVERALAT